MILAPMSPEQAAWVRENAWLPPMRERRSDRPHPWNQDICACQMRECFSCEEGRHHKCQRLFSGPVGFREGHISYASSAGMLPATFPEPCRHGDPRSFWRRPPVVAQVFLADRVCRWVCTCVCPPAEPRPVVVEQLDLFAAVA